MKDNIHFLEDGYYVEELEKENQQLKEMFEDSKTYSKQFLYKHNKNLLEANERLSRKNDQLKEKRDLAVQKVNEEREKNVDLEILLDKYKKVIEEVREYINNYDVFKEFSFPLMKRDEENQTKSSIKYEFDTSIKKELLQILDKV